MWRLCLSLLFNKLHPYYFLKHIRALDPLESWKLRAIRYVKPTNLVEVLFIFVLLLIHVMTHKQWSREKTVGLYYECSEALSSHSEWLLSWVSTSLGGAWQQETVTGWAQSHHTYVPSHQSGSDIYAEYVYISIWYVILTLYTASCTDDKYHIYIIDIRCFTHFSASMMIA